MEIILVKSGTLHMFLHGKALTANAREAILAAPYVLHSFSAAEPHTICILEFPCEYTPHFFDITKNHQAEHPVVTIPHSLLPYLWDMLPETESGYELPLMRAQAILMPLCDAFMSVCSFIDIEEHNSESFIRAMMLVSYNFHKPISLGSVAEQLGIRRETLTRMFRQQMGCTFWEYVLSIRSAYAITLLRKGKTVTEAALDSGFGSVRSFNRVFREKIGMTPTEYLQKTPSYDPELYAPEFPWELDACVILK